MVDLGQPTYNDKLLQDEFAELTDQGGMSPREAVRSLAAKYELASRDVYAIVHALASGRVD
jgi:hypothetical protein